MTTSGSYSYDPTYVNLLFDAFDRIEIRPSAVTPDHMFSARQSINSVLNRWANRGVNLWAVDLQVVPLVQGVTEYDVPENTVMMLETYIRNYDLGSPVDVAPAFATTISDATVTITLDDHGFAVDYWINIVIPVAIGGLVLFGFYQVTSVPSTDTFTIEAASNATSSASGGAVPAFATTAADTEVTVTLANHGYVAGDTFAVQVQTLVGGIYLLGDYTITAVTTNTFTFDAPYAAGSTDTADENDGETQIAGQQVNAQPTDRLITAFSRTDYASTANKFTQGFVTSFYFQRTASPTVFLWPVPDGNGPCELRYYRMRQLQTGTPAGTETADLPYRFLEAFTAELAWHLSMKWRPEKSDFLKAQAVEIWAEASREDRERVPLNIQPMLSEYYQ